MKDIRAIIVRFPNRLACTALEKVMEEIPFSFMASVDQEEWKYSHLPKSSQQWFSSSDIRGGLYEGIDVNDLLALDEDLIESMRECESVFMDLMSRLEHAREISYEERKRQYFLHLRFWNDFIEKNDINVFLAGIIPHEIPDYVIYSLCKVKNIPTLMFHGSTIRDRLYLMDSWEVQEPNLQKRYQELLEQYANVGADTIPLGKQFEEYMKAMSSPVGKTALTWTHASYFQKILSGMGDSATERIQFLWRYLVSLFSIGAHKRRIQKCVDVMAARRLKFFYIKNSIKPDLSKKFIYVPLHFQPEASTCPMAGAFVDQQLIIQILSYCLPDDVLLYVKEHPKQFIRGRTYRSIRFYKELLTVKNVSFVAPDVDTFALREQCIAIATATGTAGFEALFRQKPVLMFGHRFFQYAPGVFQIHSMEDCKHAIHSIFEEDYRPNYKELKIFMKAFEDTSIATAITREHQSISKLSEDVLVNNAANALIKRIVSL